MNDAVWYPALRRQRRRTHNNVVFLSPVESSEMIAVLVSSPYTFYVREGGPDAQIGLITLYNIARDLHFDVCRCNATVCQYR